MTRRRAALLLAGVLALGAGGWALRLARWRPLEVAGAPLESGTVRVVGVLHVHTTASDGGGTPDEVVAAAQTAGLDFVFITDHNNLDAKASEGYHGRLLVGVGAEISTTHGHLLALGIPDPNFRFWGDPAEALDDVRALGGAAFVAHPDSPRVDFRWRAWERPGPWGLEVYNSDSQWRAAGFWRLARTLPAYAVNPDYALLSTLSAPVATLRRWDELLRTRAVPLVAGADAHSRVALGRDTRRAFENAAGGSRSAPGGRGGWALRAPSYAALFRLARNHVELDGPGWGADAPRDLRRLVDALAHGRSFVALDALAPADGFSFFAHDAGGRTPMGGSLPLSPGLRLRAGGRLPHGTELRLLCDGRVVATEQPGPLDHAPCCPGTYRVEAHVPGWPLPWVLSNPIYVYDAGQQAQRRAAAAWPTPPAGPDQPAGLRPLGEFAGPGAFAVEVDPSSSVAAPLLDPTAGPDGGPAGRFAFHLGRPGPGGPAHPWAALMSRTPRDLSGTRGLSLRLRGDGAYRLWVMLRDRNPHGSDAGQETWLASVRSDRAWRFVRLPYERFRSLDPKSDGRLDLHEVEAVGLVVDSLTLKLDTRGTLWVADLGAYE